MSDIASNSLILKGPQVSSLSGNNAVYESKLVGGKAKRSTKSKKSKKVKKSNKRKSAKKCWWNLFK